MFFEWNYLKYSKFCFFYLSQPKWICPSSLVSHKDRGHHPPLGVRFDRDTRHSLWSDSSAPWSLSMVHRSRPRSRTWNWNETKQKMYWRIVVGCQLIIIYCRLINLIISIYLACKHAQHTLMNVHDGVIGTLVLIHNRVRMQSNDQIIAMLSGLFQKVQMSDVEQIKGSSHVNLMPSNNFHQ